MVARNDGHLDRDHFSRWRCLLSKNLKRATKLSMAMGAAIYQSKLEAQRKFSFVELPKTPPSPSWTLPFLSFTSNRGAGQPASVALSSVVWLLVCSWQSFASLGKIADTIRPLQSTRQAVYHPKRAFRQPSLVASASPRSILICLNELALYPLHDLHQCLCSHWIRYGSCHDFHRQLSH